VKNSLQEQACLAQRRGGAEAAKKIKQLSISNLCASASLRDIFNFFTCSRLVLRERERQRKEIRRIRRKLGLTQVAAARLTGGGHNAFSRYERGEVAPLPAVIKLLHLLDKHPELLEDIA